MRKTIKATCERCWQPMQWNPSEPRVCTYCRLAACGLHPEQIAKTQDETRQPAKEEVA